MKCKYCKIKLEPCNNAELVKHCQECSEMPRHDKSYNYLCFLCNYHTYNRSHMKYHIRKHTGEKPYNCSYCSFKSTQLSALTNHVKTMHPEILQTNIRIL